MQGNWPGLPNWVFSKVVQSSGLSDSGQTCSKSNSVSPGQGPGSHHGHLSSSATASVSGQISTDVSHFNFTPRAGKAAIGGGLAAVLQAAEGLLRLLGRGGTGKVEKKHRAGERHLKQDDIHNRRGFTKALKFGGVISTHGHHMEKGGATVGPAYLLLNKVASLLSENFDKIRNRKSSPTALAAMLPPLTNTLSNFLPFPFASEVEPEKPRMVETFEETMRPHGKLNTRQTGTGVIVEPKTGVRFPLHLGATGDLDISDQVLAGVGARAKTLLRLKSIMIYAFGFYIQPDQLRDRIGGKYAGISPEELKYRPDFYDDLLSHGVDMTIRLVVHYKGLKMGMVRSAFESSLKLRLSKIKGAEKDNGLNDFCSMMSEDVSVFQGTTIDFRWQPGGALQTEIGGQRIGTIFSHHLCRAFFDMYIGDRPISLPAKLAIGESFARLLATC